MGKYDPIGIFDSGVGGLTVVKSLIDYLPQENFIYFGDTAHVPYGNKTREQLFNYAYSITDFLIEHNVKAIVVACGTHSSVTLPKLSIEYNVPMLGVVIPGAYAAAKISKNKKIGILATQATVNSKSYTNSIELVDSTFEVFEIACPRFVPLVESGNLAGEDTRNAVEEYTSPLLEKEVDTIVLGCTHYPFLTRVIKDFVGEKVNLVNPAFATIEEMKRLLEAKNLLNDSTSSPRREFYVSGNDESFYKVGNLLLDNNINKVWKVHLD